MLEQRLKAIKLLGKRLSPGEIAGKLGVDLRSIHCWLAAYHDYGLESLAPIAATGRPIMPEKMKPYQWIWAKKNASRLAARIVFTDKSGFMLIPPVHKTWSLRGHTPILRHRYRHDRISAISGISVSPRRHRLTLYCHLYESNISGTEVCVFIRHLLRHLRGHVFVLLDNAQIHKSASLRRLNARFPRLQVEPLPSYAPQFNPAWGIWMPRKRSMANSTLDTQ